MKMLIAVTVIAVNFGQGCRPSKSHSEVMKSSGSTSAKRVDSAYSPLDLTTHMDWTSKCNPSNMEKSNRLAWEYRSENASLQFDSAKLAALRTQKWGHSNRTVGSILTYYEVAVLSAYLGSMYKHLNRYLRGSTAKNWTNDTPYSDDEWQERSECLASAVNKLAQVEGPKKSPTVIYRVAFLPTSVAEEYDRGKIVQENFFVSFSPHKETAI